MARSMFFTMCWAATILCANLQIAQPSEDGFRWTIDEERPYYTLWEAERPVFRYNFGLVPMPEGRKPKRFGDGRPYGGARSNYLHPVYGLDGEVITDDYPEHPHHRGIWWSWPVVRWKDQVADIWAVCGVWARPEELKTLRAGAEEALLRATNLWKFDREKQHPILREELTLRVYPTTGSANRGRVFDINVTLTALEEGVAIGGRPKAGYGGMTYRAAPAENQDIAPFVAEKSSNPRPAWCRYTADFSDGRRRTSLVLFQHPENPQYPSPHNVYANINCFMPTFPGDTEYPLPKGEPVTLKHRVWIVEGVPPHEQLEKAWKAYASAGQ